MNNTAYNLDYVAWLEEQQEALLAGNPEGLDWEHLREELEDLGNEIRAACESFLRQLMIHLLLYQYWEAEKIQCDRYWLIEIRNFRAELDSRMTKRLQQKLEPKLDKLYDQAKKIAQLKSDLQLPDQCPYPFEQLLSDWLPDLSC